MLGQNGLTEAVARELDGALDHHELVKVRLAAADASARAAQLTAGWPTARGPPSCSASATPPRCTAGTVRHPVIDLPKG